MPDAELVLASTSQYRAELLSRLMIPVQQANPSYIEAPLSATESAAQTAERHALGKARSCLTKNMSGNVVICGSDQVAVCEGQRLHKPGNANNAINQLQSCSNHWVEFTTAVALIRPGFDEFLSSETYRIKFRSLSLQDIETYVTLDNPIYSAGSIKAEGLGISLLTDAIGRDVTTLYGLPMMLLCRGITRLGLSLDAFR